MYISVKGGTIGNRTSAFEDYAAELTIIGESVAGGTAIVEDEFFVPLLGKIDSSGSYNDSYYRFVAPKDSAFSLTTRTANGLIPSSTNYLRMQNPGGSNDQFDIRIEAN